MKIVPSPYSWQGCRTDAWCPDCQQVIREWTCNCAGVCDIHGKTKPGLPPKAVVPVRRPGQKEPYTTADYTNWEPPRLIPMVTDFSVDDFSVNGLPGPTMTIVKLDNQSFTTGAGI